MSILNVKKREVVDYSLMFLLISISGNPFFSGDLVPIFVFLYSLTVFSFRKKRINKNEIPFFLILTLVLIFQSLKFNFFPITTLLGVYIRVLTAYLVVKILDFKFIISYIKVLYFLSITSIVFYIINNLSINILTPISINTSGIESLYPRYSVFGLFTYIPGYSIRNSGPFWEPGAFSGYLVLALFFNYFNPIKYKKNKQLVLLTTIVTTMSTTGYICILIFYLLVYQKKIKNLFIKFFVSLLFIGAAANGFTEIDFLWNKIQTQYTAIDENSDGETEGSGRFLSVIKDLDDIEGHEFFGRGFHSKTRFKYTIKNQIRTVGLTDIMVKMGLLFFIFMMHMLFSSFKHFFYFHNIQSQFLLFSFFVCILVTLTSQVYFDFALFWCFLFLKFVYPKKKRTT